METGLIYRDSKPQEDLADFVECFWLLENPGSEGKAIYVLPDGRIDLIFTLSPFHGTLLGLGTACAPVTVPPKQRNFAVSFKPLALEFLFTNSVSHLVDSIQNLPEEFWEISAEDLSDFDDFCQKMTKKIRSFLPQKIDQRKRQLFHLIYTSGGEITVSELADQVHWSARQMNRYFQTRLGLPLKTYCNILRFRTSLQAIKTGQLYPNQKFTDQSHFIKEIKKHAGVPPKMLAQNPNDQYIHVTVLQPKK
jgi:AraC-like DNA-binding protein